MSGAGRAVFGPDCGVVPCRIGEHVGSCGRASVPSRAPTGVLEDERRSIPPGPIRCRSRRRLIKVDAEMIVILRAVVYVVILSVSSVYSWTAKADARPPYSGPSVSVPFVNATDVSNPLLYVSPQITVGFKGSNSTVKHPVFSVTMDTGSVGIIVGSSYFTPPTSGRLDTSFVGPGSETLTSSGIIFTGDWYKAVVNLYSGTTIVAQSTVPVMAVTHVACEMDARACDPKTLDSSGAETHYFGIGFAGGSGQPQGTPDKNAFLNVTSISGSGLLPSPGYILSTQGVQIGLTSINTQGFALIKLEPLLAPDSTQWQTAPASTNVLTDWQHPRGTITVNGSSGSGSILFDTGVSTGFLTPPIGVTLQTGMGPENAECNGSTPPSLQFSISVAMIAQFSPPPSEPANSAFLRLSAIGRIDLSTVLESISILPSSRKRVRPSQRGSA